MTIRRVVLEDEDGGAYSSETDKEVTEAAAGLQRQLEQAVAGLRYKERCVPCEGKGDFQGEPCNWCEGTGWLDWLDDTPDIDLPDERLPETVLISEVTGEDIGDD